MTHIHKRPRKIRALANAILSYTEWEGCTFSEMTDAYALAKNDAWHRIERAYNIPCPTCPKPKKKK